MKRTNNQSDLVRFNSMGLGALMRLRSLLVAEFVRTRSCKVEEQLQMINKQISQKETSAKRLAEQNAKLFPKAA